MEDSDIEKGGLFQMWAMEGKMVICMGFCGISLDQWICALARGKGYSCQRECWESVKSSLWMPLKALEFFE